MASERQRSSGSRVEVARCRELFKVLPEARFNEDLPDRWHVSLGDESGPTYPQKSLPVTTRLKGSGPAQSSRVAGVSTTLYTLLDLGVAP